MKTLILTLFVAFTFTANSQILNGSTTVSSVNNMTIDLTVDVAQNEVTIVISGPSSNWFAYGFGGSSMFNTYSIVTTGAGVMSERKLGNHNAGTSLASSFSSNSTSVSGAIRTDTIRRPIAGLNNNYFSFPTSPGSFMLIWGKGNGSSLSNHGGSNRGTDMISLANICSNSTTVLSPLPLCTGDSILFAGSYITTPGLYIDTIALFGGCDSILQQNVVASNAGLYIQTPLTVCAGDSIMIYGSFQSQAGTYLDTVITTSSCDSILSTDLTINVVDTSVNYNTGVNFTANATIGTYQWLENCNTTPTVIIGATNATFTPPGTNGFYSVVVTQNGCSDTSTCREFNLSFSLEEGNQNLLSIHPNPVQAVIHITFMNGYQLATIQIVSTEGKLVKEIDIQNGDREIEINAIDLPAGTYFMKAIVDQEQLSKVIIKN